MTRRQVSNRAAFTLIETMLMGVLLIIAAMGVSAMLFKQKQNQMGSQQSLVGRKVLTEAISKLQAAPWQYPYFKVEGGAVQKESVTLSFVSCFDRAGSAVANTLGSLGSVAAVVDNRKNVLNPTDFKLSGFCVAPAADFEVQVTPQSTPSGFWDGSYEVWVISLLADDVKTKKGIIRHYFREQVVLEQ